MDNNRQKIDTQFERVNLMIQALFDKTDSSDNNQVCVKINMTPENIEAVEFNFIARRKQIINGNTARKAAGRFTNGE